MCADFVQKRGDRRGRDRLCTEVGRREHATAGINLDIRATTCPECGKEATNRQELRGHLLAMRPAEWPKEKCLLRGETFNE